MSFLINQIQSISLDTYLDIALPFTTDILNVNGIKNQISLSNFIPINNNFFCISNDNLKKIFDDNIVNSYILNNYTYKKLKYKYFNFLKDDNILSTENTSEWISNSYYLDNCIDINYHIIEYNYLIIYNYLNIDNSYINIKKIFK